MVFEVLPAPKALMMLNKFSRELYFSLDGSMLIFQFTNHQVNPDDWKIEMIRDQYSNDIEDMWVSNWDAQTIANIPWDFGLALIQVFE